MAATKQSSTEALKKVEEQITCSICLEHFTNPKLLPCGHSFCLQCLQRVPIELVNGNHYLPCPTCRVSCPVPDEGLALLSPSFVINNLIEVYDLMKNGHQHASCDICDNTNADRYCKQCAKFLCPQCLHHHNNWKPHASHQIIGVEEVPSLTEYTSSFRLARLKVSRRRIPLIGCESTITITLSLPNGSPVPVPRSFIKCHLSPPNNTCPIQCSIKASLQLGQYNVVFTPAIRGLHHLHATINDNMIPGGPVSVPVSVPLQMRGTPVKTITGLRRPTGIAVTDDGLMIVSDRGRHCITILDREGNKIRSFGTRGEGWGQLIRPEGVAVTSKGTILVVDSGNDRIQQFTVEGDRISCTRTYGNGSLEFNNPSGIAINKTTGQVFVTDYRNNRVQVLQPDLTFSHMFGSKGSGQGQFDRPIDVTIDSQGFVYVIDQKNHRVQKFASEGQFVSSFGTMGSQPGQLHNPTGIAIDDNDLVYVHADNYITVYTTNGQYIHRIERENSVSTYLNGITFDYNGNLYVCQREIIVF